MGALAGGASTLLLVTAAGIVAGLCFGLTGPLSNVVRARLGPMESAFLLHFVGTVITVVPMLLFSRAGAAQLHTLPWYTYTAGMLGVLAILMLIYMIPRIGIAPTMALVTGVQLMTAAVLDHYGAFGVEARLLTLDRVAGFVLVLGGFALLVRR